jgi:hypothetical protein
VKRLIEVSTEASGGLANLSIIVSRDFRLAISKMKDDITLRAGDIFVEAECGSNILTLRVVGGEYPSYRHAIPPASSNSIEVDRLALLNSVELHRVAIDTKDKLVPLAEIVWTEGANELLIESPDGNGSDAIAASSARGNARATVYIGQFIGLLKAIAGDRPALDVGGGKAPIRITRRTTEASLPSRRRRRRDGDDAAPHHHGGSASLHGYSRTRGGRKTTLASRSRKAAFLMLEEGCPAGLTIHCAVFSAEGRGGTLAATSTNSNQRRLTWTNFPKSLTSIMSRTMIWCPTASTWPKSSGMRLPPRARVTASI